MPTEVCMNRQLLSVATALLFSAGGAHAANLFENGSFESPGSAGNSILPGGSTFVTGWTTVLNGVEYFNATGYGGAADGVMIVDLAHYIYSAGGIEQTVDTVAGATYDVAFSAGNYLGFGRTGTGVVKVTIDGVTQAFDTAVATTGTIAWKEISFEFVATQSETTIRFWNDQNANQYFAFIDGVGVTPAVPEPETWALLAGGLGFVGWATRRRA
jgi:hypothetical protein